MNIIYACWINGASIEDTACLCHVSPIDAPPLSRMPGAIGTFKAEYLPGLATTTQKEHDRLLDIAAREFANFEVADVQPSGRIAFCEEPLFRTPDRGATF